MTGRTGPALEGRWDTYVLHQGNEALNFWRKRFSVGPVNVLFVAGLGFDPRAAIAIETLLNLGGAGSRELLILEFDEGPESPSKVHADLVHTNSDRLSRLFAAPRTLRRVAVSMFSADRRISSLSASRIFQRVDDVAPFDDVIVDISSLPRSIYFPLIAKILFLVDRLRTVERTVNLHVIVSENAALDRRILDVGLEEAAEYIHYFRGGVDREGTTNHPRLWIPLLGEGQLAKLEKINALVRPDEICPVLPFPAMNPRRADDLVLEYHRFLFDDLRVEPRNFIFASETNPFQVYRQIRRAVNHYTETLDPLGPCKVVLSALTSKVLSVGALLVACELKEAKMSVGIAHVEVQGYELRPEDGVGNDSDSQLFDIWITGDCYETTTREAPC